jgi:hypothetical protein
MALRGRPRKTPLPRPQNRIRERREAKGWSIETLSRHTQPHVPATTIQRHETGAGVDTRYLSIYAQALGCKAEELLPSGVALEHEERILLALFNGLEPADRTRFLSMARAFAGASTASEDESAGHQRRA